MQTERVVQKAVQQTKREIAEAANRGICVKRCHNAPDRTRTYAIIFVMGAKYANK